MPFIEANVSHGSPSAVTAHRRRQQVCHRKRKDPAGYSNAAVGAIGRTPSDVYLFSRLPEADQQAILRQANKEEFERYIGHAHVKLRVPMRQERAGKAPTVISPSRQDALGAL